MPPPAKKAKTCGSEMDVKCINTVRCLAADIVQKANSGHPGAPMGCAPMAHTLFSKVMRFSPADPKWIGRDRFVLSNGHACALLYEMLHLTGYDSVSMDDLKQFRQLDSKTPGHPENLITAGVEVSTGPLGQGISNAVGLAIAEAHMAAEFNKEGFPVIDNHTFVICGDGCMQEGVSSEASSLAGHLGLGKLIVLYDDNSITIDGETSLSFTEDVLKRYEAYGWHTQTISDVTDLEALLGAVNAAKEEKDRPSMIKVKTIIGHGSQKQGLETTHGAPLGADDVAHVKKTLGLDPSKSFEVSEDVAAEYLKARSKGAALVKDYNLMLAQYAEKWPAEHKDLTRRMEGRLPEGWKDKLPKYAPGDKAEGSRKYSGAVLNAVAESLPEVMGGSADLTPSNSTQLKCSTDFQKDNHIGRYMRFGVREHAMTAVANGMFAYGGLRPFVATFLNFMGYALGSARVSALSDFGIIFIMTHDSIGLGEDGPTHQPVEMLEVLRATPNMHVFRPADGNEVVGSYVCALERPGTPAVFALSRQNLPHLEGSSAEGVAKGGYVLSEHGEGDKLGLILIGTGSEVCACVEIAKRMAANGTKTRVVSMPCKENFAAQSAAYKQGVLAGGVPVMSVEMAAVDGWHQYAHAPFGMARFGASAPGAVCVKKFGFDVDHLTTQAEKVVAFYKGKEVPSLLDRPLLDMTYEP